MEIYFVVIECSRVKQLKVLKQMYDRIQDTRKDHPYGVLRIMWFELIFVMCEF